MTFQPYERDSALAIAAADLVDVCFTDSREPHFVMATGGSPLGLYRELVRRGRPWNRAWITKLDEWYALPPTDPVTCEAYLRREVLGPLNADEERYLAFDGLAPDPEAECTRVSRALSARPPVDLAILGIGRNGHLGLNEPAPALVPGCHVATLAPSTRDHPMLATAPRRPTLGLTLGIADLLAARRVLLIVSGEGKGAVLRELARIQVSTQLPASFLHLHPNAVCLTMVST